MSRSVFFALSEGSRQNGNSGDQLLRLQRCEPRFRLALQSLDIGVWRHCATLETDLKKNSTMTAIWGVTAE